MLSLDGVGWLCASRPPTEGRHSCLCRVIILVPGVAAIPQGESLSPLLTRGGGELDKLVTCKKDRLPTRNCDLVFVLPDMHVVLLHVQVSASA